MTDTDRAFCAAVDFADKYPFTRFADERHIDYSSALLKSGVDVNVFLIGFGKTNRAVFFVCNAVNAFLTAEKKESAPVQKRVKYFVFDRAATEKKELFSDTYYRYERFSASVKREDYLPLPPPVAIEEYFDCDINSAEFSDKLKSLSQKQNDINIAVVSLGGYSENFRTAKEIRKISNGKINVIANIDRPQDKILAFGGENHDRIVDMAKERNLIYEAENRAEKAKRLTAEELARAKRLSEKKWKERTLLNKGANIMSVLGVKVKLNLLGLNLRDKSESGKALSKAEFLARYNGAARDNLAVQEHARWNAYLFCCGYVPASREQIMTETEERDGKIVFTNGKSEKEKRHGNLTTFDGLKEFAKMTAQRDGCGEDEKDVIKYDFQVMDGIYELSVRHGFKIVRFPS